MIINERQIKCRDRGNDDPLSKVNKIVGQEGIGPRKKETIQSDEFVGPPDKRRKIDDDQLVDPSTLHKEPPKQPEEILEGDGKSASVEQENVAQTTTDVSTTKTQTTTMPKVEMPNYPFLSWVVEGIANLEQTVPNALQSIKAAVESIQKMFFGWVYNKDVSDVKELLHGENSITLKSAGDIDQTDNINFLDKVYHHDIKRTLISSEDLENVENILKVAHGDEFKPYQKTERVKAPEDEGPSQGKTMS